MAGQPIMPQHHLFVKKIAAAMRHRCGVTPNARILVAVSGGADSVALLRALALLAPRRTWRLTLAVAHVQHHLRGDAAECDAGFVADLAGKLDLPFVRADLDPAEQAGNLESRVRQMRYRALIEMAGAFDAGFVAAGHHGDDQLETILMRLLRGSSARGLGAMAWRRALAADSPAALIRPMLGTDRAMVRSFLTDLKQTWCEDHTNADPKQWRARLRMDVLPVLHELRADIAGRATQTADHFRALATLLDQAVGRAADHVTRTGSVAALDRTDARTMPAIVLTGLLRRLLTEAGVPGDRLGNRTLGPILRAIRDREGGSRTFALRPAITVRVTRSSVQVETTGTSPD